MCIARRRYIDTGALRCGLVKTSLAEITGQPPSERRNAISVETSFQTQRRQINCCRSASRYIHRQIIDQLPHADFGRLKTKEVCASVVWR